MENGCIWLSSTSMQFSDTHFKVVDSLLVPLLSFTRLSCPIEHSSATIHLSNSPTARSSSSPHWITQFMPLPISLLGPFNLPPLLTARFPSCLNIPSSFPLYNPSAFPASTLCLSTNLFTFPFVLFESFSFPSFLPRLSDHFLSQWQDLSFLVAHISTQQICFPNCWRMYPSCLPER